MKLFICSDLGDGSKKKEEKGAENISIDDMRVLFTRITSEMFIISFRFYAFGG